MKQRKKSECSGLGGADNYDVKDGYINEGVIEKEKPVANRMTVFLLDYFVFIRFYCIKI